MSCYDAWYQVLTLKSTEESPFNQETAEFDNMLKLHTNHYNMSAQTTEMTIIDHGNLIYPAALMITACGLVWPTVVCCVN